MGEKTIYISSNEEKHNKKHSFTHHFSTIETAGSKKVKIEEDVFNELLSATAEEVNNILLDYLD